MVGFRHLAAAVIVFALFPWNVIGINNMSESWAHSGGLNSQGCHGGSKPYHCHRRPSEMVGNRLRCDLGSRSKDCDKKSPGKPTAPSTPRKEPENGYVYGDSWYCNDGFRKNYGTKSCDKVTAPRNGYVYGDSWYCNDGFRKNYGAKSCDKVTAPRNGYVYCDSWYCNDGFRKNYGAKSCDKVTAPRNGYVYRDSWYCNDGFRKNYGTKSCDKVTVPRNGYVYRDSWYCNDGFRKNYFTKSCEPAY